MTRHSRRHGRWELMKTFVIGSQQNPMMKRVRVIQTPLFGIYVHFIYREDLDPDPHDHPWNFFRMVLKGGYTEEYHGSIVGAYGELKPFRIGYLRTDAFHRITSVKPGTVTLAVVGRKTRDWGFWVPAPHDRDNAAQGYAVTRYWHDYRDYLGLR